MEDTSRQTISYLRSLFEKHDLHPKKKLGQNFLIDLNLIDLLVREADINDNDLVIEVGAGTGSLTTRLAELAGQVLSVEIDPDFFRLAQTVVQGCENVTLLNADILKNKNRLNPAIIEEMQKLQATHNELNVKLTANLPYAVATPVISNFLLTEIPFRLLTVTVQLEIAERLSARPGNKDYNALSVLVQSIADVHIVRKIGPTVFWPRPQVWSAIVSIRPNARKRARVADVQRFRNFLRDLYTHRRKNLRGALAGLPGKRFSKAQVDEKLKDLNLQGRDRSETLNITQHLQLCAAFGAESD